MAVGTFMVFALGALAPFITDDLELSRVRLGSLTTMMFAVAALLSPAAGRLVDAFGARRLLFALFAVATVAFTSAAAARSYSLLMLAVAIAGASVALGNPVTNKLVAQTLAPGEQGVLTGVKQSGVQVSSFLAGSLLPPAALVFGWRGALLASVALPAVGVLATRRFVPLAPSRSRRPRGARTPLAPVLSWLTTYAFLMGLGVSVVGAYLPLYATERLGFEVTTAGLVLAAMGLVGIVARVAWGRAADKHLHVSKALAVTAVLSVLSQGLVWSAERAGDWLVWVGTVGMGASAAAWNAVGMLAIVKLLDPEDAGRASGMVLMAFYGGNVLGPVAFGYSVDATGAYDLGWAGVTFSYLLAALVATTWQRRRP